MRVINGRKLTERQRYWLDHLRACEVAGNTMRTYASEAGIEVRSLYDAKKRLVKGGVLASEERSGGVGFARAQVVGAAAPSGDCHIQFPNGITLRFSATVDGAALSRILGAVASLG